MGRRIWMGLALALTGVMQARAAVSPPLPTPQFRHYELSDGLPSSNVSMIKQDARGVMWMTTANGLVRFDGKRMRVFRHDPNNPNSLHANLLSALLIDTQQRLWVGGDATGLNRYDPATGRFRIWLHDPDNPHSLASDDVDSVDQAPDGTIWASVMGYGVDHMVAPGRFRHFRHRKGDPDSLSSDVMFYIKAMPDGSVLAGGLKGLDRIRPDGHVEHIRFEGLPQSPRVWGIDGTPGHMRMATSKGLYQLGADGVAHRMYPDILPASLTLTSARDPDGSLWVGGQFGLYWISPDGRYQHYGFMGAGPHNLPGSIIWDITFDQEGGIWIGTRDGGVAYLSPYWKRFVVFVHQRGNPDSLSIQRVIAVMAQDDHLLVGGPNGALDRIYPASGRVVNDHVDVGHASITAFAPAGQGDLWIAYGAGLILQTGDRRREVFPGKFPGGVNRIISDASGNAYITRPSGRLSYIDRATLSMRELKLPGSTEADRDISAIAMHDGRVWLSSSGGMQRVDGDGQGLERVPGMPRARMLNFAFDADGIWVVEQDDMSHYRLHDGRATRDRTVGVADGWSGAHVQAMFVDADQRVWLATDGGLWRYDPSNGQFHAFGSEDGLINQEFTSKSVARMPDGTWYAGTMRGVAGWNPSLIHVRSRPPRLVWDGVTVQRDGATTALTPKDHAIDLRWNDRQLRVRVQAMSYLDPSHNHYRFRLDGLDTDWVDSGTRGERDFSGLPHGDYVLHVEAAGPNNVWAKLAPLAISVARPPWITWWAWTAYLLVALSLVALSWIMLRRRIEQRHRMQMAERERAMAEQASAAKSSFLATLGHEIRTPMTGVLGMAELLLRSPLQARQRGYAETIQRSGTLLLRLVNEALDMARIEAGRLQLEPAAFDPRELLHDVVKLESGVASDKGLQLRLHVGQAMPARLRGDELRIKQILLNLINNALKFTERGHVELVADWVDEGLQLRVTDTGPGIPDDSQQRLFQRFEQADGPKRSSGTGLGLAICRELSELMGGRCELATSDTSGSTFRVWLPLPVVEASAPPAAVADSAHRHWNLLLVEDDSTVAGVIRGLLETRGHRVSHATQGLAALAELDNGVFDAILLDLDLPGLDGFAIARMLRERGVRLPIVAITARSGGDEEARTREAGMDGFLRKPLSGDALESTLGGLLSGR